MHTAWLHCIYDVICTNVFLWWKSVHFVLKGGVSGMTDIFHE